MTRPLTVVYRGNFQPGVPSPWSTETHVAAALEVLGHRVVRLQENQVAWLAVESRAKRADLFLWQKTWSIDTPGGWHTLEALRAAGVPSVSIHLDRYIGLDREAQIPDDPFWHTDFVFTADGGHDDAMAAYRVNHHWLPPAIHEPECRPGRPNPRYREPVIFVGSHPYPHPEWRPYRDQLIGALQARYGNRFKVWPDRRRPIRGRDLADLYASAQVVVGDSCLNGDRHTLGQPLTRYCSDRIPETLGRGGFLIHPRVPGVTDTLWQDGRDLACYDLGDLDGLIGQVDHYLAQPDQRAAIARQGRATVLARDTYRHRMAQVLAAVEGAHV